jgi:tripartite-type tricarboxylate transporter receptor subunit TctC
MFDSMTSAQGYIRAGNVKPLAISAARRSVFAPDVPTLAESGLTALKDYDVEAWSGLLAPAATPPEIIARLHAATMEAMQDPDFVSRATAQTLEIYPPRSAAAFGDFLRSELARWAQIIRDVGLEGTL